MKRTGVRKGMLTLILVFFLAGCVRRSILIESDPPGAKIWINEKLMEKTTPVTHEFITHGRYKFRLEKTGFRELVTREMVRAPLYQWIPLDFIFEFLVPIRFEDRHRFRYSLSPLPPQELLEPESASTEAILAGLKDSDPEKRRAACITLAKLRDPETASAALSATQDPVPAVRAAALEAWRAVGGAQSLERLTELLRIDPDSEVRWRAASELEALGDVRAVPALMGALKDRDPLVRVGAAEALKSFADPQTTQPLIRALKDRDTAVRRAATDGLGRIGDPAAVKPLLWALRHHDFQTRRRAAKSLKAIKDPAAGPALVRTFTDWDPTLRGIATDALIEMGDTQVVPMLIRYLRSWKAWTREHAAITLGGLKDPRAIEPLAVAFRREADPTSSGAMYNALIALGVKPEESWSQALQFRREKAIQKQKQREKELREKPQLKF